MNILYTDEIANSVDEAILSIKDCLSDGDAEVLRGISDEIVGSACLFTDGLDDYCDPVQFFSTTPDGSRMLDRLRDEGMSDDDLRSISWIIVDAISSQIN